MGQNGAASSPNDPHDDEEHKSPAKESRALVRIAFCDIDGTIVHYPKVQEQYGTITARSVLPHCFLWVEKETGRRHKVLQLLPTTSSTEQGIISIKTLMDLAHIRAMGTLLVLITGSRTGTLLQRLPFLPAADAYVCENGGRIFFPDNTLPTACPIMEDSKWRAEHSPSVGPTSQDSLPPEEKKGPLWDVMRKLIKDGWKPDAYSYATSFRLKVKPPHTEEDLKAVLESLPEGLTSAYNLHYADVFPETSGKRRAAEHIMAHFEAMPRSCFMLCDDDNDVELAQQLGRVFVVGFTSESLRRAAEKDPHKFVVASKAGILGVEELLDHVEDHVGTFVLG